MPTLLKDVNLLKLTAYMTLIMKWGVLFIWDLILGHLWSICTKIMIFAKNEEKLGAYSMHSLLKAGNLLRLTEYMPLIINGVLPKFETSFWKTVGQFVQKLWFFYQNEENLGTYCMHTLLKVANYSDWLQMWHWLWNQGLLKLETLFWFIFLVNLSETQKSWILPQIKKNQGPTVYILC